MKVSRYQVAEQIADSLYTKNRGSSIAHAAAWLVANRKQRQSRYLAQDIARVLAIKNGYVLARITTARSLNDSDRHSLDNYIMSISECRTVECIYNIDPEVIGGVRIETPVGALDETISHRLMKLARGKNE
jgi:F0F1-type ATP synthase delta subunit